MRESMPRQESSDRPRRGELGGSPEVRKRAQDIYDEVQDERSDKTVILEKLSALIDDAEAAVRVNPNLPPGEHIVTHSRVLQELLYTFHSLSKKAKDHRN